MRRTTMNLPTDLLHEAAAAIGAKSNTEAVIVALQELVRVHRRIAILDLELPDLTPEHLQITEDSEPA